MLGRCGFGKGEMAHERATWELDLGARVWTRGRAKRACGRRAREKAGSQPGQADWQRRTNSACGPAGAPAAVSVSETRGVRLPTLVRPRPVPRRLGEQEAAKGGFESALPGEGEVWGPDQPLAPRTPGF